MTTLSVLKHDIKSISEQVTPKDTHISIIFWFGNLDQPHGIYGSSKLNIEVKQGKKRIYYDNLDKETELEYMKQFYDSLNLAGIVSFQEFLLSHACYCGRHGEMGTEPYLGNKAY